MDFFEPFDRVDEKPLEYPAPDGGYSRIFRRIACIGDSLSSGEFETVDENGVTHFNDIYEQSWGQYLARMTGATVYNFSTGGMSADDYCERYAQSRGFWRREYACQAYILALGVNDILNQNQPIGGIEDICPEDWRKNRKTFAGYYAQIVMRCREIQPDAKFFFMTIPRSEDSERWEQLKKQHRECLYRMAAYFPNCYVLDFNEYAPVYSGRFYRLFYLRGHMSPAGYLATAQMVASYLDYIVRHNMDDFRMIGLL